MKADMRRAMARLPFEKKIHKIGQLLQLSAKLKAQRGNNNVDLIARSLRTHKDASENIQATERRIRRDPTIISAIRDKAVLKFVYNGEPRVVEPQTYGLSKTGKEVLRAHEINGDAPMAKLFDLSKMKGLEKMTQRFAQALPEHNPDDRAMVEIFATLPARKN